jgi:hypothetical protein
MSERFASVVQFSTGIGSAEVARREVEAFGRRTVLLLTADTLVEDEDNWRFARDVVTMLGCHSVVLADGRTPMGVGLDKRCVPNDRMAVCSKILKRKLLREWMDKNCGPGQRTAIGYDWTEPHRVKAARPHWHPYELVAPLMDEPLIDKARLLAEWERLYGFKPPRLYAEGFSHANCGGFCVRGGHAAWALGLRKRPALFAKWEADEEHSQAVLGKNVTILRDRRGGSSTPLSLRAFRERIEASPAMFDPDDWGACDCMSDPIAAARGGAPEGGGE